MQGEQMAAPVPEEERPTGQSVQLTCPALANFPEGHLEQLLPDEFLTAILPVEHVTH